MPPCPSSLTRRVAIASIVYGIGVDQRMRGDVRDQLLAFAHRFGAGCFQQGDRLGDGGIDVVDDAMHEPDALRALGVEALAGQKKRPRVRLADLGDDVRRDDRRKDSQFDLGQPELRVARGDGDVADRDEADAAADGRP